MDVGQGKTRGMSNQFDKAGQVDEEQHLVGVMYARLDEEVAVKLATRERVLARPIEDPSDRYAKDIETAHLNEGIGRLRSAEHSLCFGRIDSTEGDAFHIGRVSLRTDDGNLLLIDWRAEAARPFYSATMAAPMGVRRRRHLRLDGRRVIDVNDEILDGTSPREGDLVGDSPLVAALSAARTGKMHEAAATLQTEQDVIVRSDHRGIMVVDGGPGTGKTIVALHRAAYVLYAFESIAERGVLVFGPNQRFLTYISDVLPSLGENDVQLATMPDLVGAQATRSEPDAVARIKGRALIAEGLARWVQRHQPHGVALELKTSHDTVVLDASIVDAARRQALQGDTGHNRGRELFIEYIVDDLVNELEHRTTKELDDFEEEIETLLGINLDRYGPRDHHNTTEASDGLDIDWDSIRDDLLDDPAIDQAVTRVWPRLDAVDAVRRFLNDHDTLTAVLPDVSEDEVALMMSGTVGGWSHADLALLDEAHALIDGVPESIYGHIVVDEAQQLSEMQWRMLMRRCPGKSMTIVGDLAQAGPTTTIRFWDDALAPFVRDRFIHRRLTINYRTTAEILESTRPLLAQIAPDQELSESIRHGEQPRTLTTSEEHLTSQVADLIGELARDHPHELIGVVATTERALTLESVEWASTATIVPAPDARGLEFDTVVIIDPTGIEAASEAGMRDLYVAQTRATKHLASVLLDGTRNEAV